jgi:hypothetical protein
MPGAAAGGETVSIPIYGGYGCSGSDYQNARGTLWFLPGETSKTIDVNVCPDQNAEVDESFQITLSNPTADAQLGRSTATVRILNDDGPLTLSIDDAQRGEQSTTPITAVVQSFTLKTPPFFSSASVDYATVDGTAKGGASCGDPSVDYISTSGTANVYSNSAAWITIPICADALYEPDETFFIMLTNATPGLQIARPKTAVTIVNDDILPAACAIRPKVLLQASVLGPGRMQVTVQSTTSSGTPSNQLNSISFDRLDNARVEINGHAPSTTPFNLSLAAHPTEAPFIVNRVGPGPVTVHLTVQDSCGSWPTFVGAGPAGF